MNDEYTEEEMALANRWGWTLVDMPFGGKAMQSRQGYVVHPNALLVVLRDYLKRKANNGRSEDWLPR